MSDKNTNSKHSQQRQQHEPQQQHTPESKRPQRPPSPKQAHMAAKTSRPPNVRFNPLCVRVLNFGPPINVPDSDDDDD